MNQRSVSGAVHIVCAPSAESATDSLGAAPLGDLLSAEQTERAAQSEAKAMSPGPPAVTDLIRLVG